MSVPAPVLDAPVTTGTGGRPRRRRRGLPRSPLLTAGLVLVGLMVTMAVVAPVLSRFSPQSISGRALEQPSARHWLGTDVPGRDLFAQLLYGARASLIVAVAGGSLAMAGATLLGVLPALIGERADSVCRRVVVFLLALPMAPLLILVGSLAGRQRIALVLVIGFVGVAPNARLLRSRTLSLRQRGYVASSRCFGGGPLYLLRRHLVPGLGPLIVVRFVNWAGIAVGLEAGLAFLGLGDPSGVSWGLMMNRALGQQGIYRSPMWTWWVLPPGVAITLTVLGFAFLGVALEPWFNPRSMRSS